jgi:hypothetical protein
MHERRQVAFTAALVTAEQISATRKAERCCPEPDCRRKYPLSLYLADLSERVFVVTRRRVVGERGDGTATFAATERHDVTRQLREFVRRNPAFVRSLLDAEQPPEDSGTTTRAVPVTRKETQIT